MQASRSVSSLTPAPAVPLWRLPDAAAVGQRVAIRWRPVELDGIKLMTDVLGILEDAYNQFFKLRRDRDWQLIVIARDRALAGRVVPPAPPPRRPRKAPDTPDTTPLLGDSLGYPVLCRSDA
jgi:hypothetical protein